MADPAQSTRRLQPIRLRAHLAGGAVGRADNGEARNDGTEVPPKQSFTDQEKDEARCLMAALRNFSALRGTMPLQYVMAYLQIVSDEGRSVTEYAAKLGVAQSVMSRHILDIGPRNRHASGAGFNLVEQGVNPVDPGLKEIKLTQKGRGLYNAIRDSMHNWRRSKR